MTAFIGRREFITLLGGATAAACPFVARAQQAERMRRIGMLLASTPDNSECPDLDRSLPAGAGGIRLDQRPQRARRYPLGYAPNADAIRSNAAELAALAPDVILAHGSPTAGSLQRATPQRCRSCSCSVVDPVAIGLVESLARPGGNVTGFLNYEFSLSGKWLELLKQIAPGATRMAVLRDPAVGTSTSQFAVIQAAASSLRGGG